ncbi:hypothetical protein NBRC10513v2_007780 [Rhodotorula toruloides]
MAEQANPPDRARSHDIDADLVDDKTGMAKYACEQCKRRKLKCSRTVPTCTFCAEHSHDCIYSKIIRTPLTRKNLDAAEKRIANLEALLARHYSEREITRYEEDGTLPRLQGAKGASPDTGSSRPGTAHSLPPPPPSTSPGAYPTPASQVAPLPQPPYQHQPVASTSALPYAPPVAQPYGYPPYSSPNHPHPPIFVSAPATSKPTATPTIDIKPPLPARDETDDADGTGSLSLASNGKPPPGYLGSLSGAALLQFLQRCAADVNLSAAGAAGKCAASPSSSTTNSLTAILPDQLAGYITSYFNHFHLLYPVLHESSFRAQLAEIVPRPGGAAWTLLYYVVLGLGSMCTLTDTNEGETLTLYEQAISHVAAALFESASITSVQAFCLLANLAQKTNHVSIGTVFLGIALRMAINLGLHTEASGRHLSVFEQEMRRRAWWLLFAFDSGSQLTFGHPNTLPTTGVDVLPLVSVPDTVFTPSLTTRPQSFPDPTIYSSLIFQCFFHQMASQIVARLTYYPNLPITESLILYHEVDSLQSALPSFFFSSPPAWFDFPRHLLAWRLDNLRMVVLRHTFLKVSLMQGPVTEEEERGWAKCVDCAAEVVRSVQRFSSEAQRTCMEWWYALHFIIPSTFIPLIALRVRPASPSVIEWVDVVQSARSVLERVPHTLLKFTATRCLAIISAVADLSIARTDSRLSATNEPSAVPDSDFTNFLEMLAGQGPGFEGEAASPVQAPGLLPDLDTLLQWFTPSGSPLPVV